MIQVEIKKLVTKVVISTTILTLGMTLIPKIGPSTQENGAVNQVEAASVAKTTSKYTTTASLNLRSGASTKHKVLVTIPKGKAVTYVSKSGSWSKVKYGSKTGFVSTKYLKVTKVAVKPVTKAKAKPAAKPKPKAKATVYAAPSTKTPGKYVDGVLIVNKKHKLPSTYNPGVSSLAQKGVNNMVADAKKSGITLKTISTFRTYSYQTTLYNNYVKKHGKTKADRFSARPGYSEHQTGLAFDFGGTNQKHWLEESFAGTKEGKWLNANAHKYGFILRYQKGKESITGYMYEPWHFRYIGSEKATKVKSSGKTLEEYLKIVGK